MLTDYVGMFGMSLVVHAVGGILLILYMKLFVHEKLKISGMPWYLYSAGFFGIFLVVTSSYCIGVLGVSVVTCLSVTGQLVISAVIDHFGWFGVPRIPFNLKRLPCFALILAGSLVGLSGRSLRDRGIYYFHDHTLSSESYGIHHSFTDRTAYCRNFV